MIDLNLKNANILVIDDQQVNIDLLGDFLKMQGFDNVQCITNPLLTLELFNSFKPDLILLDLMMPQMSGFEVMEMLKPLIPPDVYLPILVLTADISSSAKQRAMTSGARDFITKPFDFIDVFLRIRNLLETRYLHQELEKKNRMLEEKIATIIEVNNMNYIMSYLQN